MEARRRYRKKAGSAVVAIRFDLDIAGFTYRKWGGEQRCKKGDWLVDNGGDVYTVDAEVFARTYRPAGLGTYMKTAPVWAAPADRPGSVSTKEGSTSYEPGDYLVYNDEQGTDAYAVSAAKFGEMYELDE
jgi:hypothetical protein